MDLIFATPRLAYDILTGETVLVIGQVLVEGDDWEELAYRVEKPMDMTHGDARWPNELEFK